MQQDWLRLQAALLEASGEALQAARTRDRLSDLLTDPDALAVNRRALWNALERVPLAELQQLVPPPPDRFGGCQKKIRMLPLERLPLAPLLVETEITT